MLHRLTCIFYQQVLFFNRLETRFCSNLACPVVFQTPAAHSRSSAEELVGNGFRSVVDWAKLGSNS